MNIFVASIPHTASQFVASEIFRDFEPRGLADPVVENGLYQAHIGTKRFDRFSDALPFALTVIPMRHPGAVSASWARRGRDVSELAELWALAERLPNAMFLPVDTHDRNERLRAVERRVGVPLSTDWGVYGAEFGDGARSEWPPRATWAIKRFYCEGAR